jgi:CRP/FNR family cyclic AMP-dependent transcriptional regulator
MIGTTRSRVNLFMNKFKKLGFIENKDGLQINSSLLGVLLHDQFNFAFPFDPKEK